MALNGAPIIERYSYSSVYPSTIDFHQRSRGPKRMLPEKPSPASEMLPPTDEMLPLESTSVELPSFEFIAIIEQRGSTLIERSCKDENHQNVYPLAFEDIRSRNIYSLESAQPYEPFYHEQSSRSLRVEFTVGRLPSQLHRFRLLLFNSVFMGVPVIVYRLLHVPTTCIFFWPKEASQGVGSCSPFRVPPPLPSSPLPPPSPSPSPSSSIY
ncbi:hypothetical protein HZH66_004585 [Vespula vulgaris]|uniref:Uncharacterized protein n=1 Tax=Vespula vulgaris TaxID=7454 RepID=A0A834NCE8_VESVU|nr:hypothetical protein HZH66_004585 [Vespula vulgaris]